MSEDDASDQLRGQLEDDGTRGVVFLGWQREDIGDDEMRWKRSKMGRNFSLGYGSLEARQYDCLVDNFRDGMRW